MQSTDTGSQGSTPAWKLPRDLRLSDKEMKAKGARSDLWFPSHWWLSRAGTDSQCLSWLETEAGSREGGAASRCPGHPLLADVFPRLPLPS